MTRRLAPLILLLVLTPLAAAQISRSEVRRVIALPGSCQANVVYNLTQVDGSNQPGLYRGNGSGTCTAADTGSVLPAADSTEFVKGSADATKRLRFEVDGFTAGTTRVVTFPDADVTVARTNGTNSFSGQYNSALINVGNSGGALAINWNSGNVQLVTLNDDPTITFSNPQSGGRYVLILKQDGAGSHAVTWPAEVLWPGGTEPTLTITGNKVDIITFVYDGVSGKYYGGYSQNY
jgi:hypothetical protein